MGDGEKTPLKLNFDSKVRLEFRGVTITSDAGLLACRELDDALGLTDSSAEYLKEGRTGKNILHKLISLLRQSIYSRLAGYDDTNDADRLSQDPAMRVVVGWKGPDRKAASTSEMSRFETELLTQKDNRKGLEQLNVEWVKRGVAKTVHRRIILDIDSSESPVHGQQEGAAYNGHFECMCYHPLFCFNQFGDCEGAVLRPGNVHSADGWEGFIEPIVERYLKLAVRLLFRADAAFAKPELYEYMEARRIGYAIRLPANDVLQREIAHLLVRPTEWPSRKPIVSYHDFAYQAQSWDVPRRVIAKVEWHQGELFPRVGIHSHQPELSDLKPTNRLSDSTSYSMSSIPGSLRWPLYWTRLDPISWPSPASLSPTGRRSGPTTPWSVSTRRSDVAPMSWASSLTDQPCVAWLGDIYAEHLCPGGTLLLRHVC